MTGEVEFPPGNRTDWDGIDGHDYDVLRGYLRNVSETATWNPGQCLPAFPSSGDHKDVEVLQKLVQSARRNHPGETPVQVDDPNPLGRLEETLAGRRDLCVYDERMQDLPALHFQCNHKKNLRMLVHFYVRHLLKLLHLKLTTLFLTEVTVSRLSYFLRIGKQISG